MKKTILVILFIIMACAIGCICVIELSGYKVQQATTEEATEDISQETSTSPKEEAVASSNDAVTEVSYDDSLRYDDLEGDSQLGELIMSTTGSPEPDPDDATTQFPECFDLELEIMSQYPELPAGCESVSLTMILNYLGYDLNKTDIVDDYLVYSGNFVMGYCGDPYSYSTGGGCYAPGMTITANNFLEAQGGKHTAENITGTDFDTLLEYVAQGHPILIWSTINMAYCNKGHYNYDEEGNAYAWDYNEHCVVLTGYDLKANSVTIYDPIAGIVYRDRDDFEVIYHDMDDMAVIIR